MREMWPAQFHLRLVDTNLKLLSELGKKPCSVLLKASLTEEDEVIAKFDDGGPRYQYMTGPNGPQLVDLWLKTSDLLSSTKYDPNVDNQYHLFTRHNRSFSQPIPLGADDELRESNFNPMKKTVFIIHGWMNTPDSDFNVYLPASYLNAEDVNVIMVDWSVGAGVNYLVALRHVIRSGEHVARYITWLINASGGDISRYHIIGHSLGAHQAGVVGRHLGGRVPYLTGLDPAMPGWITSPEALTSEDALYTEVMHTNAGVYGIVTTAGHVDFYPNGGRHMSGCEENHCNHHMCIFYMAESLERGGFNGRRCDSVSAALKGHCNLLGNLRMGGTTPKPGHTGIFYLETNAESPYSQG